MEDNRDETFRTPSLKGSIMETKHRRQIKGKERTKRERTATLRRNIRLGKSLRDVDPSGMSLFKGRRSMETESEVKRRVDLGLLPSLSTVVRSFSPLIK